MAGPLDWDAYFEATADRPLRPFYADLERHLGPPGLAIDLGCGLGQGTMFLAERGWQVVAQDAHAGALATLGRRLEGEDPDLAQRVALLESKFQSLALPPATYDLALAMFSLFFMPPEDFQQFWPMLTRAIKPGGIFAGQLLGPHDAWSGPELTRLPGNEVRKLFGRFDLLHFEEADRLGHDALGRTKHWHVFHIVAKAHAPV